MRRIIRPMLVAVIVLTFCAAGGSAEGYKLRTSVSGAFKYGVPRESGSWERMYGGEADIQVPLSEIFAIGFVFGLENWDLDKQVALETGGYGNIHDTVRVLPVGLSVRVSPKLELPVQFSFEGGVRGLFLDSEYHLSDGLVGVLGLDAAYPLNVPALKLSQDKLALFAGMGYQFDLDKPEFDSTNEDMSEGQRVSLESWCFRVGLRYHFDYTW